VECSNFTIEFVHVLLLLLLGLACPTLPLRRYKITVSLLLLTQNKRNSWQQLPQLNAHRGSVCVAESSTSTCKRCEEE